MALGLVGLLLVALGLVALASAVLALRHRLAFRIAMRNVRRGRTRTVLVLLGLLVGTTIVSGALVIGDTVNAVNVHFTYQAYGFTDEAVYNQTPAGTYAPFPYAVFSDLTNATRGAPGIAGIAPEIVSNVSILDRTTGVPQPALNLIGVDANTSGALGPFHPDAGGSSNGPGAGTVFLDDLAAQDLNASVGDHVVLYARAVVPLTVGAIVKDDTRGGFLFGGNAFVDLATAQALENTSGRINFLAVTNAGSLEGGVALSSSVSAQLNQSLVGIGAPSALSVHQLLKDNLAQAQSAGSSLSTLFLVLGLFSIIAGAMLIVGIFVMLAEERKGEMGMLRAIGLRRRELVLTYYFEGLAYSAGSALAGTVLGVAVGFGMTVALGDFIAGSVVQGAILSSFTASPESLVIGYVVGFLLTLATITVASSRASRLNIVRAIRSIPEPPPAIGLYTGLAALGAVVLAAGAGLFALTYRGSTDISLPLVGGALVLAGVAMVGSRFAPNRLVFSLAGAGFLVWSGLEPLHRDLLGSAHTGSIFVFFIEGVLMILGAILLYVFNSDAIVGGVTRLLSPLPRAVPVVRVGLSYPSRRPFRTAINLTIFAMVLFTIVAVASFGNSIQSNLDNTITAESGGYTFYGVSAQPVPDLPGALQANRSLAPLFSEAVPLVTGFALASVAGGGSPFPQEVYAAPTNVPANQSFYASNQFNFTSTLGSASAQQVFHDLASNASVALVDHSYAAGGIPFNGPASHPGLSPGAAMALQNPETGVTATVTVIGVLSEDFVAGVFVNPSVASALGFRNASAFFLTVAPGQSAVHAAQAAKAAFFPYGLVLVDFSQVLRTSVDTTQAFILLLEIFVALGLAVGIAGMGIVALRAVVERRSEIGMLRATGFTRGGIFRVFLLEYSFVSLVGIGIGTALGILLDYDAATSGAGGGFLAFAVPWLNVATVVAVAYALTVLAVLGPSVRAARLPPAEAVRYSE